MNKSCPLPRFQEKAVLSGCMKICPFDDVWVVKQVETVSMNGMGYMYYHGLGGLNRDVKKAFEFLEKANSKDKDKNANIVFNLGLVRSEPGTRWERGGACLVSF